MSATPTPHLLFGSSWNANNFIIAFDQNSHQFQRLAPAQDLKINNWSSVIPISNDEFLVSGGLGAGGKVVSSDAFIFNASTKLVSPFPSFHQCRYVHQSLQHHGRIYLLGGRQYGPDFESVLSHCEVFDQGAWKPISPMSKRRSNFAVFIYRDKIHVIGGFDGKKNTRSIEYYDEEKNTWHRLKTKTPRGLAGFSLIPLDSHRLLLVGGMTIQGPTRACTELDLQKNTCIANSSFLHMHTLFHMGYDGNNYFVYGGMNKPNWFEVFVDNEWVQSETISVEEDLIELFDGGLRGFSSSLHLCVLGDENQMEQVDQVQPVEPDDISFLIGNDEFPFILPIFKRPTYHIKPLEIPTQLGLFSYMSTCSVDAELPNCRQIFISGGIDQKISQINKKSYLITIIFPEMKIKAKKIGKLSYHRYAAACVYLAPYVYVIGGRGYQNDLLSLLNTVERFNVDDEEWEQISPLNESKCSMTASIVNDNIYVVGGYIGEGQMSHKIERFDEQNQRWRVLNVELPFSLEGLSSIVIEEVDLLIIGGKGIDGSRKDVIRFNYQELEGDEGTSGQIVGQIKHARSLPKPVLLDNKEILIIGGYFYDNPDTNFGELYCPLNPEEDSTQYVDYIESVVKQMGAQDQINMFAVAQ